MNRNRKVGFFLIVMFCLTLGFAQTATADNAVNPLRGQYRLSTHAGSKLYFYLRSSGSAGIIRAEGEFEYSQIDFYLMQGLSDLGPDPLPVGHILITYGSDEETVRLILRLAKVGEGQDRKIDFIDAISTFMDGPNDYQSWSKENVKLERYERTTKKWLPLN